MHGPPPSWFDGPMVWPDLPIIKVYDTVAPTLRPRKAKKWRAQRDEALEQWGESGLGFAIEEVYPDTTFDEGYINEEIELRRHIYPGALRLMKGNYKLLAGVAWSYQDTPGSVAMFRVSSFWWMAMSPWRRQFVTTHEIGHAIGLNHRTDDERSIMYSVSGMGGDSLVPDAHDLTSLESYYGL